MVHLLHEPDDRPRLRRERFRPARLPLDPRREPPPRKLAHITRPRHHPALRALLPPLQTPRARADQEEHHGGDENTLLARHQILLVPPPRRIAHLVHLRCRSTKYHSVAALTKKKTTVLSLLRGNLLLLYPNIRHTKPITLQILRLERRSQPLLHPRRLLRRLPLRHHRSKMVSRHRTRPPSRPRIHHGRVLQVPRNIAVRRRFHSRLRSLPHLWRARPGRQHRSHSV